MALQSSSLICTEGGVGVFDALRSLWKETPYRSLSLSIRCCGILACDTRASKAVWNKLGLAIGGAVVLIGVGYGDFFPFRDMADGVNLIGEGCHVKALDSVWRAAGSGVTQKGGHNTKLQHILVVES